MRDELTDEEMTGMKRRGWHFITFLWLFEASKIHGRVVYDMGGYTWNYDLEHTRREINE